VLSALTGDQKAEWSLPIRWEPCDSSGSIVHTAAAASAVRDLEIQYSKHNDTAGLKARITELSLAYVSSPRRISGSHSLVLKLHHLCYH